MFWQLNKSIPLWRLITLSLLTMIIGQEKICAMVPKRHKRMSSCGGVVGADEPLQVGSSSRKRSRGLADGSERGSGQCPEALRDFAICTIDFHQFLSFFQLGKMSMIGTFLYSIVPIRDKSKSKTMEAQSQLSQTVHIFV